jgi:hypothetical protein
MLLVLPNALPSNILLSLLYLYRVFALPDMYRLIIASDNTVAGFVNLDAIACVDVIVPKRHLVAHPMSPGKRLAKLSL